MRIRFLLGLALSVFTTLVMAPAHGVTVAFLELYEDDGRLRQLEPGGRFSHVAIRVGNQWLHAHPDLGPGVGLTDSLENFGVNIAVYTNPALPEPTPRQVEYYLGLDFNRTFEWVDNDGTTYCSRLVGELLGIEPLPAYFLSPVWGKHVPRYGAVGLSPDDVHQAILKMGFTRDYGVTGCELLLSEANAFRTPDTRARRPANAGTPARRRRQS